MKKSSRSTKPSCYLFIMITIMIIPAVTNSSTYAENNVVQNDALGAGPSNSGARHNDVTAASGNNRYMAWVDETPGKSEIFFRRSTDSGAMWMPVMNISNNAEYSLNPKIVVSSSNVYLAWEDMTPGKSDIFFRRSTDNGATWKAVKNLSNNAGDSQIPQIAITGSNVYAVWFDTTSGSHDIFFRSSTDNGATWKAVKNLSNNAGDSVEPEIAVSGSNVYVAWQDNTPGNSDVLFRMSTDSGATWNAVKNLSNNAGNSVIGLGDTIGGHIAVSGSNVYVAWQDNTSFNYDILFRRSTDSGVTWKAVKNLSNNAGDSQGGQIAVSGSNVYVAWSDFTTPDPNFLDILFRRSTDGGATWKAVKNLSNNAGGSGIFQLALSGSNVYVLWLDTTPGNSDVFFRRSTDSGATWKAVKNLSNNAGDSFNAQIAVSGSNVYVAWQDNTPGNSDVLFRRSTDSGATWNAVKNLSNNSGESGLPQIGV